MSKSYDFAGWATKNDIRCSDGRIIRKDAFKGCDGQVVPLVWNHMHGEPANVLGHALLKNFKEGVRAFCSFNDTDAGTNAKMLVRHGDIVALSIYANNLKQKGSDVLHGAIREVSLVLAAANPGAFIDNVIVHGEESNDSAIIYTGLPISIPKHWKNDLLHSSEDFNSDNDEYDYDPEDEEDDGYYDPEDDGYYDPEDDEDYDPEDDEDMSHSDMSDEIEETFNTLTPKQKKAVYAIVGLASKMKEKGGDADMKHNVFDTDERMDGTTTLMHSDITNILNDAKRCGSLREAVEANLEGGILMHATTVPTDRMEVAKGTQKYGFNDPNMLFPEYRTFQSTPEWISRDMAWVSKVMSSVHHSPFSRVKSVYANITEDEARAKGYLKKGTLKKEEVFSLLKRTTDPQTIYKKQKMDRDDIIDITDFDVVAWIKAEMRVMLNEEIARAILIGDGRLPSDDDHISEEHVRPIWKEADLFAVKVQVSVPASAAGDENARAKAIVRAIIKARKNYKGSGEPTFFTTEDMLTDMLLIEDGVGRLLYPTVQQLATTLRVKEIVPVEVMENQVRESGGKNLELLGIIVNLRDYNVGADKGGAINMFEDFDIDYNQEKYLIETRISGALVKPFSALVLEMEQKTSGGGTTNP